MNLIESLEETWTSLKFQRNKLSLMMGTVVFLRQICATGKVTQV